MPLPEISMAASLLERHAPLTLLDGQALPLSELQGKVLLLVNTASQCGFTPQYEGLEALYRRYRERGFAIVGFPCNQFGKQEPGDAGQIGMFCQKNYGVTFPISEKIEVNGANTHPLWRELKTAKPGFLGLGRIKWNFTKFLLDRDGRVVKRYAPYTKPEQIAADIERLLGN
jgi:glutathione peroxidase